ncbi:MAG TPA: amino acid permease [Vicinamibacterales bacterium]|nr:amino acid permease [Vicinamibacterales bacterium]
MIDPIPAPPPSAAGVDVTLERRLGPLDAAAIVVSNVIGGGIFFVPIIVAQMVPHPGWMLGLWLAGGLLAFVGAMAFAELAAVRPHAGGEYVYLRDAYGPLAAFLTGWTSFIAGFSGAIAASAIALADYVTRFVPAAASAEKFIAVSAIAILTLIHVRGLGPGRLVQNLLAGLKVTAILLIIAFGFAIGNGDAANLSAVAGEARPMPWLLALVPVMFSYSGWNAAAYVAEEVRNPSRNVPLALGLGTAAVIVLYLALNALYLFALPISELAAVGGGRLMDTVAERLFGFATGNLLAVFTIISLAASISAMVLAGPRVYFAMARDGIFVRAAGRVHPRFHTPATAIVAQAVWSCVLVLSGTLSQLVNYTGFAVVLFAGIAVSALFPLRRRRGGAARPFSAFGYPWAPAIFVLASALMVGNAFWREPIPTTVGAGLIALGIPVYFAFRTARRP